MTEIAKMSGLDIGLGEGGILTYPHSIMVGAMSHRDIKEMREFLKSGDAEGPSDIIYRVYRDVADMKDADTITKSDIEYDLTVILPGVFSHKDGTREFYRTAGHYHRPTNTGVQVPEIYEVVSGHGYWLIQKYRNDPKDLAEIYLIEGGPGDKICVPPSFAHITINAGDMPLLVSNIWARGVEHDYEPFRALKGGGYLALASKDKDMVEIEHNGNYRDVPPLLKLKPRKDWYSGYSDPLYAAFVSHPERFDFLKHPEQQNKDFFATDKLFENIS